jgi:hypothetical protein
MRSSVSEHFVSGLPVLTSHTLIGPRLYKPVFQAYNHPVRRKQHSPQPPDARLHYVSGRLDNLSGNRIVAPIDITYDLIDSHSRVPDRNRNVVYLRP